MFSTDEVRPADADRFQPRMRIVFVGHGRAGKDTACEMWAAITGDRNAGTCSLYLAPFVAERLGVSADVAYAQRHTGGDKLREFWRAVGDDVRREDPAKIVRLMARGGAVGGGLRGRPEIRAARRERLARLFVWIANDRVAPDPTMEFGPEECDVVIENNGTLEEFCARLESLARFAGAARTFRRSGD